MNKQKGKTSTLKEAPLTPKGKLRKKEKMIQISSQRSCLKKIVGS